MMVEEIEQIKIIDAALGSYYTFVVSSDRTVYQWGGTDFPLPIPIPELRSKNITEISAGPYHFLALDMKGNIYSWGNGRQGKLGFKNSASLKVPMKIPEPIKFGKARLTLKDIMNQAKKRLSKENENNIDEMFKDTEGIFKYLDDNCRVKTTMETNKDVGLVQVCILQKQTIFLTNSGSLYGCGSSEQKILE